MRKHVKGTVSWVGYIDWELESFHGDGYSIMNGSSQNAYLIEEEKTVLIDTVWTPHRFDFVENLKKEIDLKKIDFIVANHGECDHSGSLTALMEEIPDTPIYCTANAVKSIEGQYGKRGWNFHVVKTGDSVDIGNGKKLVFVEMRMLHWPDSMATFMTGDNILFSNDAFGQHYAVEEYLPTPVRASQDFPGILTHFLARPHVHLPLCLNSTPTPQALPAEAVSFARGRLASGERPIPRGDMEARAEPPRHP